MATRYSDRFFGPDAAPGPAYRAQSDHLPAPVQRELVDLVEGTDIGSPVSGSSAYPPPPHPWHSHLPARLALVGALLVGGACGAYGWSRWRDHQTEVVARSAVDLTSRATIDSFTGDGLQFGIGLTLQNDGLHPLTIEGFSALDNRLTPAGRAWAPVELDPGEKVRRVISFAIDCGAEVDAGTDTGSAVLTAQVHTVDGGRHDEPLDVDYYSGTLTTLLDEQCAYSSETADYSSLFAEVVEVEEASDDAVAATIALYSPDSGFEAAASPQTYNVVAASSGFSTVIAQSSSDPLPGVTQVRVLWTVRDCTQAAVATDVDMNVELTGQMPSESTASTLVSVPSTALAVALTRLSERVCG